jgi:hypothetical protein
VRALAATPGERSAAWAWRPRENGRFLFLQPIDDTKTRNGFKVSGVVRYHGEIVNHSDGCDH